MKVVVDHQGTQGGQQRDQESADPVHAWTQQKTNNGHDGHLLAGRPCEPAKGDQQASILSACDALNPSDRAKQIGVGAKTLVELVRNDALP
jgi:hypothetical protein